MRTVDFWWVEHTWDHVANFCGNRPTELEDVALKKAVKHKAAVNYRSGQSNK